MQKSLVIGTAPSKTAVHKVKVIQNSIKRLNEIEQQLDKPSVGGVEEELLEASMQKHADIIQRAINGKKYNRDLTING